MIPTLIARAIAYRVPSHEIGNEHTFGDLDIGELDRICIASEVEEHFCVDLSDDEVTAWESVADVARSVKEHRVC